MAKLPSLLKARRIHVKSISQLCQVTKRFMPAPYTTLVGSPALKPPSRHPLMAAKCKIDHTSTAAATNSIPIVGLSSTSTCSARDEIENINKDRNTNPCLDLFYSQADKDECLMRIEQRLPLAWSYNPLTTLKLIFNVQEHIEWDRTSDQENPFYRAAFWLHQNHPKTLLSNLWSISTMPFGSLRVLVQIPILVLKESVCSTAVEMYECDPNYKLLHDHVSDVLVEYLKSDIKKLNKHKLKSGCDKYCSEITDAARCCLWESSSMNLLRESIARKIFPQESYPGELEAADYAKGVRKRLREEVLEPLSEAFQVGGYIRPRDEKENYVAAGKYLEEVKAGTTKIAADALLPHEIVGYVDHWDLGKVAELQWKAMLEDKLKRGKMKNCLAVCSEEIKCRYWITLHDMEVWFSLQVLMCELNEEPWKGKVVNLANEYNYNDPSYKIHLIPLPGDELRYKCDFLRRWHVDWRSSIHCIAQLFDMLLEEAVSRNLKPDEMIKKVVLFTCRDFDDIAYSENGWEIDGYEEIQSKFKEKGYANAVPHLVFCRMTRCLPRKLPMHTTKPGVTLLAGSMDFFVKLFADRDGEIGLDLFMEADIFGKEYEKLVVVD